MSFTTAHEVSGDELIMVRGVKFQTRALSG